VGLKSPRKESPCLEAGGIDSGGWRAGVDVRKREWEGRERGLTNELIGLGPSRVFIIEKGGSRGKDLSCIGMMEISEQVDGLVITKAGRKKSSVVT